MTNIMRILFVLFISLIVCNSAKAQILISDVEQYPLFEECEEVAVRQQESCFKLSLNTFIKSKFEMPESLAKENFAGNVTVLFEVTKEGMFKVLYIDAISEELKTEMQRVFEELPVVKPATYNGKPAYIQFRYPIYVPFSGENKINIDPNNAIAQNEVKNTKKRADTVESSEYEDLEAEYEKYEYREFESNINIPFSHEVYSRFDFELNRVGTNAHTSVKPFLYGTVNKYYDFKAQNDSLKLKGDSWLFRKFFNERLIRLQGKDYWFNADVAADLQVGKDFDADFKNTYNNTRAAVIQGGIGKNLNFYAAVYESQGRFAGYFNNYAESIKPDGGNPAVIPGRGIAKSFKEDSYDYPTAEGYISYSPNTTFNFQFGHGKNFIGDGYRSLLMSDVASPYPYFKVSTSFWKLKYTNTWMSLRDIRPEVTESGSFRTKYMATHYLSYNITKRLNIGLFESVLWENDNDRGFDINYLNPIIFYRAIEFSTGSRGGNALIGLAYKYKISNQLNTYGQLMIDEFSSKDIIGGDNSYKNKIGYQLGLKYFNAFNVDNLYLQMEYNRVRPYTYSHNSVTLNYGHNNQSMAHIRGANFSEAIFIARYRLKRWYGQAKFMFGAKGYELTNDKDPYYGGDIYGTEYDRETDLGNEIYQGNKVDFTYGEFELGYLVNPATNLKVYASIIQRNLSPTIKDTELNLVENSTWLNFGLRTDLFNWYYDF
ncbi:gliding motility protein RemB [Mesonia ostreae]|uniref:Gliding motility protein RemB n=1 Tax=Mesonia ostreae TaxID=861110 RepID=A0ABU2KFG4_9FLAO|nr:gliding motility protein RemB [Mesonia ostreae]MDT0293456.1 gliding motility protein RemB [Mesonia ostreae]